MFRATFEGEPPFTALFHESIVPSTEIYDGTYTVTPVDEPVILATKECILTDDITVNPIPQNYGKITWNGSFLTVS